MTYPRLFLAARPDEPTLAALLEARDALLQVARDRLLQAMGSQFFVEPVVAFLSVLADADDDYRFAQGPNFEGADAADIYKLFVESAEADAA